MNRLLLYLTIVALAAASAAAYATNDRGNRKDDNVSLLGAITQVVLNLLPTKAIVQPYRQQQQDSSKITVYAGEPSNKEKNPITSSSSSYGRRPATKGDDDDENDKNQWTDDNKNDYGGSDNDNGKKKSSSSVQYSIRPAYGKAKSYGQRQKQEEEKQIYGEKKDDEEETETAYKTKIYKSKPQPEVWYPRKPFPPPVLINPGPPAGYRPPMMMSSTEKPKPYWVPTYNKWTKPRPPPESPYDNKNGYDR